MKEKPKKSVRMWVARDEDDSLWLYEVKPIKNKTGNWISVGGTAISLVLDLFPSVKREDKEPTRVVLRLV